MSHRYRTFGLSLESDIKLDELAPDLETDRNPDLRIVEADLGIELKGLGEAPGWMDFHNPEGVLMAWHGVAAIRIASPDLIEIQRFPGVPEPYLGFPLLGPVMGWVMHARGYLVLHASAVQCDGRSLVFLGDKGAGKSTTATAFLKSGAALLTDDLLVVDLSDPKRPLIHPAFAQIKLNEAASSDLELPGATALPLVFEGFPKRQFRLAPLPDKPVPCDYIFQLQRGGERVAMKTLDGTAALISLLRFSYNVRFQNVPPEFEARGQHMKNCAALANAATVATLQIPHDMDALPDAVESVRQKLAELGS
jgi:hypothetical protein